MKPLYEISTEILRHYAEMDNGGVDEEILASIENLQMDFTQKVQDCAHVVKNLEAQAKVVREEAQNLAKRAGAMENRAKWLKEYVRKEMHKLDKPKVRTRLFTVSIQKNSQPSVDSQDLNKVPDEYVRIERSLDKRAIIDHLKETGETVKGCTVTHGEHLRIR
jgi:hypothetical protein